MTNYTSLINFNFGGIRRKDSMFSADKITCSDCQNVDLYYTKLNSGVGIRTTKGNISVTKYEDEEGLIKNLIPEDEEVVGIFESIQIGQYYMLVYTESLTEGKLYHLDIDGKVLNLILGGLSVTGNACGCDSVQGWLDMFVFSNGKEIKFIYGDNNTGETLQVKSDSEVTLVDQDGRTVQGLGVVEFDSRVWIFNGRVLWYSQQGNCTNFQFNSEEAVTSAGYIEFVKEITAIHQYLGALAIFFKDSSVLLQLDEETGFKQDEESPGGCASYNSLVFHGTDLYFYDNTKKGVYSFMQIVNGDKTLGDNIALDIQEELMGIEAADVDKIRALSVVTSDRNEVWFLVPISSEENYSYILIYDYLRGEWLKRKCPKINAIAMMNNRLYSGGKHVCEEYVGYDFNDEFIPSYYQCTVCNLGTDNTMKITKFPPRLTMDSDYTNDFYVQYTKNYNKLKAPKVKRLKGKSLKGVLYYDTEQTYDHTYSIYLPNALNSIMKAPSATFKALEILFYTEEYGQEFCIKALEFSKIKVKQV